MARSTTARVHREIRRLYSIGTIRDLGDGQLLERFATDAGEPAELAFAVLVERHGPMVLRVCHSVLSDWHDTEDAFQATFLVLVQKARGLWVQDSLGPWLHQVAVRTASAAKVAASRRRRCDEQAAAQRMEDPRPAADPETVQFLHQEIERLPERFRIPLVLCDLEACTHQQAARHLGWPIGTVKSRLARGREQLRIRLVRRGLSPGAGFLFVAARHDPSLALRLPALIDSTARAALLATSTPAIAVSSIATIPHAVFRTMIAARWVKVGALVLAVGAAGAGGGSLFGQKDKQTSSPQAPAAVKQKSTDDFPHGTIGGIKFEGTTVPTASIVPQLLSQPGQPLDRERLAADLKTLLGFRWFVDATYTLDEAPPKSGKYTVTFMLRDQPPTSTVWPGKLHPVLSEPGIVTRANTRAALNRVAGESVIRLILPEGSAVKKGDLVCTIDSAALKLQIDHQQAAIKSAESAYEAAVAAHQAAQAALSDYKGSGAALRANVLKALQAHLLDQQENEKAKYVARDAEKQTAAQLSLQMKNCDIVAPSDGIIVYANDGRFNNQRPQIANGATVRERQIIFQILDMKSPLRVVTHLPRWSISRLKRGSVVKIRYGGLLQAIQVLTGKIDEIAPLPDTSSFLYHGPSLYTTRISIDEPPPDLVADTNVRVEIDLGEFDNVLTVPVDAVVVFQHKDHVAVKTAFGGFEWRVVALGATVGDVIEVTKGVKSGEVVLREPAKVLPGVEKDVSSPGSRPALPR